ncbi:MAG: RluA family pseudouridine synthase [Thermoanaerobaculia bacterium]
MDGQRLDGSLAKLFPEHSRSFLARLIEEGEVEIDGIAASKRSVPLTAGQRIVIRIPEPVSSSVASEEIPIAILFEDSEIAVIEKPAGLVVHPSAGHAAGTLVNALLFHVHDLSGVGGELRPGIVHRLDKDTSGLMVIAKNDRAHRALTEQWSTPAVRKEYLALVYGHPRESGGSIDQPIGRDPHDRKRMAVVTRGRPAVTDWKLEQTYRYASLLRCVLRTGRTHQIRVHLKALGHPIIGDPVYSGPQWKGIPDRKLQKVIAHVGRQALHAAVLIFDHPVSGERMRFESPLPEDLQEVIDVLRQVE